MIILNKTYSIEVDDRNYTLMKITTTKTGKNAGEKKKLPVGYYGTLVSALNAFRDRSVSDSLKEPDISLSEAINIIRECDAGIKALIESVVPGARVVFDGTD